MSNQPIAIVGLSGLFPEAQSITDFWNNIIQGKSCITDVPESRWKIEDGYTKNPHERGKTYSKRGGFIPDINFSPIEFGITPQQMEQIDCAQLLSLVMAKRALQDAGYPPFQQDFNHDHTAVILGVAGISIQMIEQLVQHDTRLLKEVLNKYGCSENEINKFLKHYQNHLTDWKEDAFPGALANIVAGRIANRFQLGGSNCTLDAACASSLAAIDLAVLKLQAGQCDLVLTGGVDTSNHLITYLAFSKTPVLTQGEYACSFDANADGTITSEGIGMLVLKRLSDAQRDNDRIYAVIRGVGASSDGCRKGIFAPDKSGQRRALEAAYQQSELEPSCVNLIEAHSPGTRTGDDVELAVLTDYFKKDDSSKHIALGSVKSQIGHTKAAAGAASLIKTALALYNQVIPPSLHVKQPNPILTDSNSPFYITPKALPAFSGATSTRFAGVSSFGFGGTNYHAVLQEYKPAQRQDDPRFSLTDWPIILTASTHSHLQAQCLQWIKILNSSQSSQSWVNLLHETQHRQISEHELRLGFLTDNNNDTIRKLTLSHDYLKNNSSDTTWHHPTGIWYHQKSLTGKVAAVFSGQGSQYADMGRESSLHHHEFRDAFHALNALFVADNYQPLTEIMFSEENNALNNTHYTQAAVGAFSQACYCYLRRLGLKVDECFGHSFGEITALWAAGGLADTDYFSLIYQRGKLFSQINQADMKYLMLAVQIEAEEIKAILPVSLHLANINSARQSVITGLADDIETFNNHLQQQKIHTRIIPVSAPFHTSLLTPMRESWKEIVKKTDFQPLELPVHSNVQKDLYSDDIETNLANHPFVQANFKENILASYRNGVRIYIEVGPRNILSKFIEHTLDKDDYSVVALNPKQGDSEIQLRAAMLQLRLLGVDFNGFISDTLPPITKEDDSTTISLSAVNYISDATRMRRAKTPERSNNLINQHDLDIKTKLSVEQQKMIDLHAQFTHQQDEQNTRLTTLLESSDLTTEKLQCIKMIQQHQKQTLTTHQNFIKQQQTTFTQLLGTENTILPVIMDEERAPHTAEIKKTKQDKEKTTSELTNTEKLLSIISSKTGYPKDVLDLAMDLESDLGIDSIKRVEIFSAIQEAWGSITNHNQSLLHLKTLNDILLFLDSNEKPNKLDTKNESVSVDFEKTLISIISKKTGYPLDVIDSAMALEADLGVDSIKRVEIFSALKENLPTTLQAQQLEQNLLELKTIKEIATYLQSSLPTHEKAKPMVDAQPDINEPSATNPATTVTCSKYILEPLAALDQKSLQRINAEQVIIVADNNAFTNNLKNTLHDRAPHIRVLTHTIPYGNIEDIEPHIESALSTIANKPSIIIYIPNAYQQAIYVGLLLAKLTYNHFVAHNHCQQFILVTSCDGKFGLSGDSSCDIYRVGLQALIKTLNHEWTDVTVKAIDLNPSDDIKKQTQSLADEIFLSAQTPLQVGLCQGNRWTINTQPVDLDDSTPLEISKDNVFIVSGGGAGITASCIQTLAKDAPCHFILLGRTQLKDIPHWALNVTDAFVLKNKAAQHLKSTQIHGPTPKEIKTLATEITRITEINTTIKTLTSLGCKVDYFPVDITHTETMKSLKEILGAIKITGIIHGAGVLADKYIQDKSIADLKKVVSVKLLGLENLMQLVNPKELRYLILFSSTAATYGNAGQADYAIANAALNQYALCFKQHYPQCQSLAINWGPWESGMVDPSLKKRFQSLGIGILPTHSGTEMFCNALKVPHPEPILIVEGCVNDRHKSSQYSEEKKIDLTNCPFLKGHLVRNTPVLPMAWAMLWAVSFCRNHYPQFTGYRIESFDLLKGILIEPNISKALEITIEVLSQEHDILTLQATIISSHYDKRTLHYQGIIQLLDKPTTKNCAHPIDSSGSFTRQLTDFLYQHQKKLLTYGPDFQGVDKILDLTENKIHAQCHVPKKKSDYFADFNLAHFNPYAYDIATHVTTAWLAHTHQSICMPARVEDFDFFKNILPGDSYYVTNEIKECAIKNNKIIYSMQVHDKDGALYFSVNKITMVALTLESLLYRQPSLDAVS